MVEITVAAMELAEESPQAENLSDVFRNIASDLIFFVLFQSVSKIIFHRRQRKSGVPPCGRLKCAMISFSLFMVPHDLEEEESI